MASQGANSNVNAGKRVFHIQTLTLKNNTYIRSEIYEKGKLLTFFERRIRLPEGADSISEDELRKEVNEFHNDRVYELEMLFDMSEKVRSIKHAISNNKMGMVFLRLNLYEDAVDEFKLAISHNPKLIEAYTNLGRTYIEMGDYFKAIAILNQASRLNPNYADIYNHLGMAYLKTEKYDEAMVALEHALDINYKFYEAIINKSLLLVTMIMSDNYDDDTVIRLKKELIELLKRIVVIIKNHDEFADYSGLPELAMANEYIKIFSGLTELKNYLQDKNSIVDVTDVFYLKFMFGGEGKNEQLIAHYENLLMDKIRQNPNYADLHNAAGILHLIQCRNTFLKAIEDFKRALEINPAYETAKKNLRLSENDGRGFLILLRAILK